VLETADALARARTPSTSPAAPSAALA
jgi:hypothetical protein